MSKETREAPGLIGGRGFDGSKATALDGFVEGALDELELIARGELLVVQHFVPSRGGVPEWHGELSIAGRGSDVSSGGATFPWRAVVPLAVPRRGSYARRMQDQYGAVIARSRVVSGWVLAASTFIAAATVLMLVFQWASVYLTIGGAESPTGSEVVEYNVTTGIAFFSIAAGIVTAMSLDRKALLALHVAGAFFALLVVVVLAFPSDRWTSGEGFSPAPGGQKPCYSGSRDCN